MDKTGIETREKIAAIASKIFYEYEQGEVTTAWLELELTRLYCDGVLLGREQAKLLQDMVICKAG